MSPSDEVDVLVAAMIFVSIMVIIVNPALGFIIGAIAIIIGLCLDISAEHDESGDSSQSETQTNK